ncbi:MAG TPA: hypothetical protein VII95_10760, partial [Terriglobales bacterium]
RNQRRLRETSGPSLRPEPSFHTPTHFIVTNGFAAVQRSQPCSDLIAEPRVVFQVVGKQFLHYLLRALAGLGSDLAQLFLHLGRE